MNADALGTLLAGRAGPEPGTVWLVGAGPGDPGHLTLDALAGISKCDVILHDALIDDRVLALAGPEARLILTGKRGGQPSIQQARIHELLIQYASEGLRVVRLKSGDPLMFGRGGEEMFALASAGIRFRILPGVTSGLAAMASTSIPATLRSTNQAVVFATGHTAAEERALDWNALAQLNQPLVLYMGMRRLGRIADNLMNGGMRRDMPVAVITSATKPDQDFLFSTLKDVAQDLARLDLAPPGIVVIGDVVNVPSELAKLTPSFADALS